MLKLLNLFKTKRLNYNKLKHNLNQSQTTLSTYLSSLNSLIKAENTKNEAKICKFENFIKGAEKTIKKLKKIHKSGKFFYQFSNCSLEIETKYKTPHYLISLKLKEGKKCLTSCPIANLV